MLPLFEMLISEDLNNDSEVYAVAGVDKPAIGEIALKFSEGNIAKLDFATVQQEERILIGAAMIPNLPIFRTAESMQGISNTDCNVFYTAETIQKAAVKFFAKGYQGAFNTMHSDVLEPNAVVFFMSFIKDEAKGIAGLKGDYPNGTWFLGGKVISDKVWADVQSGLIKGWSVEGKFKMVQQPQIEQDFSDEQTIEKIKLMLKPNI